MTKDSQDWNELMLRPFSRRTMLRSGAVGGMGLAAAALIGCGDDDDDDDGGGATETPTATATATGTQAPSGGDDDDGGGGGGGGAAAGLEPSYDYIGFAQQDGAPFAYGWKEPDKTPVAGGTLKLGVTFTHSSFDNITSGGGTTQMANSLIGDFLVGYHTGPDFNVYEMELDPDYGLATSWEVAPDGLTITFNLREANYQNIAPVNGRPFVAQDVALAFARMQAGRQAGLLLGVDSVEAADERTAQFNMERPNADMLIILGNRELPIYPQEVYDAGQQDTDPVGTGPTMLDKSRTQQDQVMAFVKNPDYWGGEPLLDGLDALTIQDAETRKAAFRTGQIHQGLPTALRLQEYDNLWADLPNFNIMDIPVLMGIQIYAVNSNVAPFTDKRVRRALKLGLDVDRYLAIRFPGLRFPDSVPAFGWPLYADSYPGRESFGSTAPFDPDEAMKLLSAAGVEDLTIRYRSPEGFAGSPPDQDLLIEDMGNLGITVDKLPADGQAFARQYYSQGWSDPEVRDSEMLCGWSTASPTANGYFWENIHSQSSTQHFNIVDETVDDLADRQFAELDPDARRELHKQIVDLFNEEAYFLDKVPAQRSTFEARPELRYYRFHGPYIGLHAFWDWGYGFHKAWLDPDPPAETLTVDLR